MDVTLYDIDDLKIKNIFGTCHPICLLLNGQRVFRSAGEVVDLLAIPNKCCIPWWIPVNKSVSYAAREHYALMNPYRCPNDSKSVLQIIPIAFNARPSVDGELRGFHTIVIIRI